MSSRRVFARSLPLALASIVAAIAFACDNGNGGEVTTPPTSEVTPSPQATPTPPVLQLSPRPTPVPATENVLSSPDFETCTDAAPTPCAPWFALKPPNFTLSDVAQSGAHSAMLQMREGESAAGAKVFYLVQEVLPTEFPEVLSGFYRVENWLRGTQKQYLQFVVIVFQASNSPQEYGNFQIRYILTGIDEDPFAISNAKFVYLGDKEPTIGEWVPFQVNVKQDFLDLWGVVPEGYERIRLLFEVRYDDKIPQAPAEADVFYDNLYFGPAERAPTP